MDENEIKTVNKVKKKVTLNTSITERNQDATKTCEPPAKNVYRLGITDKVTQCPNSNCW